MDRGFSHSNIHRLVNYVKTVQPNNRNTSEARTGLRLHSTNEEFVEVAKKIVKKISGKNQKKQVDALESEELTQYLSQIQTQNAESKQQQTQDDSILVFGPEISSLQHQNILSVLTDEEKKDDIKSDSDSEIPTTQPEQRYFYKKS